MGADSFEIGGIVIGMVSFFFCMVLFLAHLRKRSLRKPPGNLAMWGYLYFSLYLSHWITALPAVYRSLEGIICDLIKVFTWYSINSSLMYLMYLKIQVFIALKSMRSYQTKRNKIWHIFAHGLAILMTILAVIMELSQNQGPDLFSFDVCFYYHRNIAMMLSVFMLVWTPICLILLSYSRFLCENKSLYTKMKPFEMIVIIGTLSNVPLWVLAIISFTQRVNPPIWSEYVKCNQVTLGMISSQGIFHLIGRAYTPSLLKKLLLAIIYGSRTRYSTVISKNMTQSFQSLSIYPLIQSLNTIVRFIQNIRNMLNTLSVILEHQPTPKLEEKKDTQDCQQWEFTIDKNMPVSVKQLYKNKFATLKLKDQILPQDISTSVDLRNSIEELEQNTQNPGGKGFGFILFSLNRKYIIKTLNISQLNRFHKIAREYFQSVVNRNSLLSRIYGVFQIHMKNIECNVTILQNIFQSSVKCLRFDLKGSQTKRKVNFIEVQKFQDLSLDKVYKDVDFQDYIGQIQVKDCQKFLETVKLDTKVLCDNNIMDYSLLVGILPQHFD